MPSEALSCPVCYSEYDQVDHLPRIIPGCGHTVCSQCVCALLERSEIAKCPLDNRKFSYYQRDLSDFPLNYTVMQLFDEKSNKRVCPDHNEKLRLICLTDKCHVCDDCVFSGTHKGHNVKSMKKIKSEADQKKHDFEEVLKGLDIHDQEIKEILQGKRTALLKLIKDKFQELRWILTKKELEVSFEVNSLFDIEEKTICKHFGMKSDFIENIRTKIRDLKAFIMTEDLSRLSEQDLSQNVPTISSDLLDEQAQQIHQRLTKISNHFSGQLASQVEAFTKLEFPIQDFLESLNITSLQEAVDKKSYESYDITSFLQNMKVLSLELQDGWTVISNESGSGEGYSNKVTFNIDEWKKVDKVLLKLDKGDFTDRYLQKLAYISKNLEEMTSLKIDFVSKNISEKELTDTFTVLLGRTTGLKEVSIDLSDCNVGDQSLISLVSELLPKIYSLKSLSLNLGCTKVTDATIEAFAQNMQHVIKGLETFDLRLWGTKVTDKSVVQLFSKMDKVKRFTLDLGSTKVTNMSVQALANFTLPTMNVLEEFKLGLANTDVLDESISQIFVAIKATKSFLLYLHGTKITDKSLEVFARRTLPNLQTLEVFEMRLGETKVSDQSVTQLFINLENVKKFVLKLQSTNVTDKTVDMFTKKALGTMKSLESFEMDVSDTQVSEKYVSQLAKLSQSLRN